MNLPIEERGEIESVLQEFTYFDNNFRSFFINDTDGEPIVMRNMEDVISNIKLYEQTSNTKLRVTKSNMVRGYRQYKCVSHRHCTFKATFGPATRNTVSDNTIVLKRNNMFHTERNNI